MYDTTAFTTITTTTGLDITAPVMFVSKTGQFKIIGSGVIKNTKTGEIKFKGDINGLGIHYLNEQGYRTINKYEKIIIYKDITKRKYCIKENIPKIHLQKSLQTAKQTVSKIFNDKTLLSSFSKDIEDMDKNFEKLIDESVKYDEKTFSNGVSTQK